MDLPLLLDISKSNGIPIIFKVGKGEIVYLKDNSRSKDLFHLLLKADSVKSAEGQLFDYDLNIKMDSDKLSTIRQKIGYIDPSGYLDVDKTIEDNARFYINAIEIDARAAFTRFESYRKDLDITRGAKIKDLTPVEKICFKIALALAKNPIVLLMENPFNQLDPASYKIPMEKIYNLIRTKGITYIASISDKSIMQTYPGRYIEL